MRLFNKIKDEKKDKEELDKKLTDLSLNKNSTNYKPPIDQRAIEAEARNQKRLELEKRRYDVRRAIKYKINDIITTEITNARKKDPN